MPWAALVAVIVAFGIAAPLLSFIVPKTLPAMAAQLEEPPTRTETKSNARIILLKSL
jgi:hypothetical protein